MFTFSKTKLRSGRFVRSSALALTTAVTSVAGVAQQPQLSLADLLIGLRSKKATVEERNAILAAAVRERGITFTLTPEIEKELSVTGAWKVLLDAVREKSVVVAAPKPTPAATPVPTPTPPDFNFYKTRADGFVSRGEFALALNDYDKAVSIKPDNSIAFLSRGRTHFNLNDLNRAGADFDRAIELSPSDAKAFFGRGAVNEKLGNLEKAVSDYQKAVDLEPANEEAKTALIKVRDQLHAKAAPPVVEPPKTEVPPKAPEFIMMGSLSPANAVKMITPVYPVVAQRSRIEGKIMVEVELDEKGNVTSAKAVSGHRFLRTAAEDAAQRSKFKPAMFGDGPVKGKGTITYNFNLQKEE